MARKFVVNSEMTNHRHEVEAFSFREVGDFLCFYWDPADAPVFAIKKEKAFTVHRVDTDNDKA